MTRRRRDWLNGHFSDRLGITPAGFSYPNNDLCFYSTNHGELQETDEAVYLKIGFVRSPDGLPLVIDRNKEQRLNPADFPKGFISGNGHLIRFYKHEPRLAIFMTFMATSQVFYMLWEGGILCATDMRVLLRLADGVRLDEEAVPMHLMFRVLPGPKTYFKDVFRVYPGEIISWSDGALDIRRLRDMYNPGAGPKYDHLDSALYEEYFERLSVIMNSYVREIERRKGRIASELSGGTDSSLIQVLLHRQTSLSGRPPTFSFRWAAQSFEPEVAYARQAIELLGTRHTFVDLQSDKYPDLLVRAVEKLAQPTVYAEADIGHMVLAEHLAAVHPELDHIFMGQGSEGLHGIDFALALAGLDRYKSIPGRYGFYELYRLFGVTVYRKRLRSLPDVVRYALSPGTYACLHPPANLADPINMVAIPHTTFETLRHFLGDQAVVDCLEHRRSFTESVLTSHTLLERVHDVQLIFSDYDPATEHQTLFSTAGIELIPFYLDQEVIRLAKSVSPEARYIRGNEVKPILKSILRQESFGGIVHKKKLSSSFWPDFRSWMMTGYLREAVHSIERPGCINQNDFQKLIHNEYPFGYDLVWPLLTYDIFQKRVGRRHCARSAI